MKLKLTLLMLLVGFITSSMAQQYAEDYIIQRDGLGVKHHRHLEMVYGVVAGVVFPQLSEKHDAVDVENRAGYGFGMMWGVNLGSVEIVPEFWYIHSNTTLSKAGSSTSYDIVSHDIEVPIIFAIPIGTTGIRFNVGPTFSLVNNTKVKEDGYEDVDLGRTRSTAGYLIGVSWTLQKHYIFDFRYTGRYVSTDTAWFDGADIYEYRYYNFGFNVGYRF